MKGEGFPSPPRRCIAPSGILAVHNAVAPPARKLCVSILASTTPLATADIFMTADDRLRKLTPNTVVCPFALSREVSPQVKKVSTGHRHESTPIKDLAMPSRETSVFCCHIRKVRNLLPSLLPTQMSRQQSASNSDIRSRKRNRSHRR